MTSQSIRNLDGQDEKTNHSDDAMTEHFLTNRSWASSVNTFLRMLRIAGTPKAALECKTQVVCSTIFFQQNGVRGFEVPVGF